MDPEELDPGIAEAVLALRARGIDTFASCQGGPGHTFAEPVIRFEAGPHGGWAALTAALEADLPVKALRRCWHIDVSGAPQSGTWELVMRQE